MDLPPGAFLFLVITVTVSGSQIQGDTNGTCVVPKCCPLNQSIPAAGEACQNTDLKFNPTIWDVNETVIAEDSEVLNVIIGNPCKFGRFRLEPHNEFEDEFHILCNGSLWAPYHSDQLFAINNYCLEVFRYGSNQEEGVLPLVCLRPSPPPPSIFRRIVMATYPIGLLISVPFLLMTILVFSTIPELRDTQGKSLCCHCLSLTVAYISLATVMLIGGNLPQTVCITLAFVIQFSFVSCFLWLNVLCIDTWWRLTRKPCWSAHQERVRFIWYSLYAWSCPLIIAIITILLELTPVVPDAYLKPNFGLQSCWFENREAAFPYFYGPIGLVLMINVCLFCLSINAVRQALEQRVEEEMGLNTEQNPCSYSKASRRIEMFRQCLILFLVMGLNWILELVSYFVGGPIEMWVITDTLNTLQGVIIYFVFIVRIPRVKHLASTRLVPTWGSTTTK